MQKNSAAANNRKTIEAYIPMVKFIAAVCGPRCEVALHDLDDINHSIVAIENGHITGRRWVTGWWISPWGPSLT